jgi:hypothetical protein
MTMAGGGQGSYRSSRSMPAIWHNWQIGAPGKRSLVACRHF